LNRPFAYPSTRYAGSKRRFLDWIWQHVKDLKFNSALDVFGGTASVSLLFKRYKKSVHYNDILKFNQIIGKAIIENDSIIVTDDDIEKVLNVSKGDYPNFIQKHYRGIFFLDHENIWLDRVITNIRAVRNPYKRSILLASLFQACLAKRPFNLFHRANLYLRTSEVKRTFGNKTTWERPFAELFKRYVAEYNKAVFSNGKKNRVVGGFDALYVPNGVDLVYCDPPYFASDSSQGTDYLSFYHFLEGLANYSKWEKNLNWNGSLYPKYSGNDNIKRFCKKADITSTFQNLIERFQDNIVVLSYQSGGTPTKSEIIEMFHSVGKKVKVYEKPHRYVLSSKQKRELLFIAK
jgi:adenine-specific DNA methylase